MNKNLILTNYTTMYMKIYVLFGLILIPFTGLEEAYHSKDSTQQTMQLRTANALVLQYRKRETEDIFSTVNRIKTSGSWHRNFNDFVTLFHLKMVRLLPVFIWPSISSSPLF